MRMPFEKGDPVIAITDFVAESVSDTYYNRRVTIPEGTAGVVTSIKSTNVRNVKFEGVDLIRRVDITNNQIALADGETLARIEAERAATAAEAERERERKEAEAAVERKRLKDLATPKEGDIMPDDPRLAWLWAKIEQDGQIQGYCDTYDGITDRLGLPGRERDFSVTFQHSGVELSGKFKGRNPDEVKLAVQQKFPGSTKIEVGKGRR